MAKGRLRAKTTALQEALSGFFTDHHAAILHTMLANIDRLSGQIAVLDTQVADASAPMPIRSSSSMRSPRSASPPPRS
jgi:hypothetical protein